VLPCSYLIAFENKSPTLAPTSGELFRPPSASTDLRHAAEESFSDKGCCIAATGPKPGNSFSLRSSKPEDEGHQSNTPGGGVGPRDQGHGNHSSASTKEEGEDAAAADLQRKIDEATEEVRHLAQDEQDRRPQHRELCQEGLFNEDGWYDDFNHDTFTFDDAFPLAVELQATPWPLSYKPPQLPMYDGHSDPKQFLMSYEATISSYGGQYRSHGEVFRHGSSECSPNMVFLSSARDYHVVAEA
jgi:hypothetical protein